MVKMASNVEAETPFANPEILTNEEPLLIETLVAENVVPGMVPFLSQDEREMIEASATNSAKTSLVLDFISRRTACNSYQGFNAFLKLVAGTQPELFKTLVGRPPFEVEEDFCIHDYTMLMKKEIKDKGHTTDSPLDEKIDFDNHHVQLHIIKGLSDKKSFGKTETEHYYQTAAVPHEYQRHLSELANSPQSISPTEVLEIGDRPPGRVLLSGRAGVGKTTTLQWLARQWAEGVWATSFSVLFLLQLRMLTHTDTNMTAIELLTLFGLFQLTAEGSAYVLGSWLKNKVARAIVLIDGLDEISDFGSRLRNTPKITSLHQKAHPIDLCINIIRGDLLPGCTLICTSRPFTGLTSLDSDAILEVLGLTRSKIMEFVHKKYPNRACDIISVLERNLLLMSVSGITFYCMAISRLLNEDVCLMDEDIQTYTRLTAFILIQYISRKIPDSPFLVEVGSYFPKLAQLAYMGIFQSEENQGMSKIVFNQYDLNHIGLTAAELESIKKMGVLQVKEVKIGQRKSTVVEFLHLSMQEMLAVAYLLSNQASPRSLLRHIFRDGQFSMARMFILGLCFDNKSDWIKDVKEAVSKSKLQVHDNTNISHLIDDLVNSNILGGFQLLHESQNDHLVKEYAGCLIRNGMFKIENSFMTAIDILAVNFVSKFLPGLKRIVLLGVNADCTFVQILLSTICKSHMDTIQSLNLSHNCIGNIGANALSEMLNLSKTLQSLDISHNSISDDGAKALSCALNQCQSLQNLKISFNYITERGAKDLFTQLCTNTKLKYLDVSENILDDGGSIALGEMLLKNQTLTTICAEGCQIREIGSEALAAGLAHNRTLCTLHLGLNKIGLAGTVSLAEALKNNQALQNLNLSSTGLGSRDAMILGEMLQENKGLKMLDVSVNVIGDDGVEALAKGLGRNRSLRRLNISCNNIQNEGVKALGNMLQTNETLLDLNISQNGITSDGLKCLSHNLHLHQSLQSIDISENNIDLSVIKGFVKSHPKIKVIFDSGKFLQNW